jgi:hypothetical protein
MVTVARQRRSLTGFAFSALASKPAGTPRHQRTQRQARSVPILAGPKPPDSLYLSACCNRLAASICSWQESWGWKQPHHLIQLGWVARQEACVAKLAPAAPGVVILGNEYQALGSSRHCRPGR